MIDGQIGSEVPDGSIIMRVKLVMTRRIAVLTILVIAAAAFGREHDVEAQPWRAPGAGAAATEAARLDERVAQLRRERRVQEAIPLARRSLALWQRALGPRNAGVASPLTNLGLLLQKQGAYREAALVLTRALKLREETLGADHLAVASSLVTLAELHLAQRAHDKAEPLLLRALEIREAANGGTDPDVLKTLETLSRVYTAREAYDKAESLQARVLEARERTLGTVDPSVARSLSDLATTLWNKGQYGAAEPLLVRAVDIWEKVPGAPSSDKAASLNNLAMLYKVQGIYGKAEPLLVRALEIWESSLGPADPDVAAGLDNLASLYQAQSFESKAEPLLVRALDIREKALDPRHPDIATSLTALGRSYRVQGAYAKAEPLLVRALDIRERGLGAMHSDVAASLTELAFLRMAQHAYAKAEPLLIRALDIRERALGPEHDKAADSLNNLASLYLQRNDDHARAEPLLIRALRIHQKQLGEKHPAVAVNIHNLAYIALLRADYRKAETLLKAAIDIAADVRFLTTLAWVYRAQGAPERAEPLLSRAEYIRETQRDLSLGSLSTTRKRELMNLAYDETSSIVSLHVDELPTSPRALNLALTTVLRHKGRVLDSLLENRAALRAHLSPMLRDELDELVAANAELSSRRRAQFAPHPVGDQAAAIAALQVRIDKLESGLNAASVAFRVQTQPLALTTVQNALPAGSALVEIVRYRRFDARRSDPWREERYVAYVVPQKAAPSWVVLGEAAPIDAEVDAALAAMHSSTSAGDAKAALRRLDARVWAPLHEQLANVHHVIVSPDSKLNLVPFEALVDPAGQYELERRLVTYVGSGGDLVRITARQAPRSSATVVAAPDYDSPVPSTGLGAFRPLAGALAELTTLTAHFPQVRVLTGREATKQALAAIAGPAVVHFATHSFYVRGAPGPITAREPPDRRGIYIADDVLSRLSGLDDSLLDPTEALDRAGLALAGANLRPDGIVSAREMISYDWWGTQLIVLSACETGVGAVPVGEGVYGMRRALTLAGAATQVVTLWAVSDAATSDLMRTFYGELARGTGRGEALRQAKLRFIRQSPFAHPYYWAAFIAAGDWTALDASLFTKRPRAGATEPSPGAHRDGRDVNRTVQEPWSPSGRRP